MHYSSISFKAFKCWEPQKFNGKISPKLLNNVNKDVI